MILHGEIQESYKTFDQIWLIIESKLLLLLIHLHLDLY